MLEYIPFVTSPKARNLVKSLYSDAEIMRVSLEWAEKITLPSAPKIWVDAGVDGLHDLETRRSRPDKKNHWFELAKEIPGFERIGDPTFVSKPDPKIVEEFVVALLDRCVKRKPAWITVPQLPIVDDSGRNKINRGLAKASGDWKTSRSFSGSLILPLIFTHQRQINGKTQRNPKVSQAEHCYHDARADGFWVVDASLSDESGSKTLRNTRIPALIDLHQELNNAIPSRIRIAGPYWGVNLVLWARGLIDFPAIGVGGSYQYHLSGGPGTTPSTRIAIGALRRRVNVAQLRPWLEKTLKKIGSKHPEYGRLEKIHKRLLYLTEVDIARKQVALFYKDWIQVLGTTPPPGRSMALFQDLAKAFAFGRSLEELPKNEGTARRPESVVEPLMLNCV